MNRPNESNMSALSITDPLYMWIMAAQENPDLVSKRFAELAQNDPKSIPAFLKVVERETCGDAAATIPFTAQPAPSVPLKPQPTYESIPLREFESSPNTFDLHLVEGLFLRHPSGQAHMVNSAEISKTIDEWNGPGKSRKSPNKIKNGDLMPATKQDLKIIAGQITTNPTFAPLREMATKDGLCIVHEPYEKSPHGATYVDLKDGIAYWSSAGDVRARLVVLQYCDRSASKALRAA